MWNPVTILEELNDNPSFWPVLLLTCAICAVYSYHIRSFMGAWDGLGVRGPKFEFLLGYKRAAKGKGFVAFMEDLFRRYGKNVASYSTVERRPVLSTYDVKLLKHILVKDFSNFVDRGDEEEFTTKSNLKKGLFFLHGNNWRRIRSLLSPIFSSGKLKLMMGHINRTGHALGQHLVHKAEAGKEVGVKQECGHYTSELIAVLGFGLNPKAVGRDDDSEFTQYTKGLIDPLPWHWFWHKCLEYFLFMFPFLMSTLNKMGLMPDPVRPSADTYFSGALEDAIVRRKTEGARKTPDFLDLMLSVETEDNDAEKVALNSKVMTHDELLGQSKLLLFAGYETTSTTFSMCLYLLANHPDIQERVYQEIQEVVKGENPTYEDLHQLKYTEQVINETLRLFPPLRTIGRLCKDTRTYDGFTIPARTHVQVHIWKVLKDPEYWEDPETFNPERFSDEEKANRDPLAFIPFGYGPRLCIGQRLAYMKLKVGLVHVLSKVKLELNDRTQPKKGEEMELDKDHPFIVPEKPIQVAASARNVSHKE